MKLIIAAVFLFLALSTLIRVSSQTTSYLISGRILQSNGTPLSGVKVFLQTGSQTVTDTTGTYSFRVSTVGTYTVTPISNKNYQYNPCFIRISVNGDVTTVNFTAVRQAFNNIPPPTSGSFQISGKISTNSGTNLKGVK